MADKGSTSEENTEKRAAAAPVNEKLTALMKELHGYVTFIIEDQTGHSPDQQLKHVPYIVNSYLEDAQKALDKLTELLGQKNVDFQNLEEYANKLKVRSETTCCVRVQAACLVFIECCKDRSIQGCRRVLQEIKIEYLQIKERLQTFLQLKLQYLHAKLAL